MTELRAKITRRWRPTGAPARRVDDFAEGEQTALSTRALTPAVTIIAKRRIDDIQRRCENWGRWANAKESQGAACMTGAICDRARRAAVGNLLAGPLDDDSINSADAERLNSAFVQLAEAHRQILLWTYLKGMKEGAVSKVCGFERVEYGARLAEAQVAIESTAGKYLERRR